MNRGSKCRLSVKIFLLHRLSVNNFDLCQLSVNLFSFFVASWYFFPRFVGSQQYFSNFVASRLTPFKPAHMPHSKLIIFYYRVRKSYSALSWFDDTGFGPWGKLPWPSFISLCLFCYEKTEQHTMRNTIIQAIKVDVHNIMECFGQTTLTEIKVHNAILLLFENSETKAIRYKLL